MFAYLREHVSYAGPGRDPRLLAAIRTHVEDLVTELIDDELQRLLGTENNMLDSYAFVLPPFLTLIVKCTFS